MTELPWISLYDIASLLGKLLVVELTWGLKMHFWILPYEFYDK